MFALKRPISLVIVLFWFSFWMLNALDKILARKDLGSFRWWGNDRIEKFTMYFDRLSIDAAHVYPILMFAGIVEFAVALPFLYAGYHLAKGKPGAARLADLAIALSIVIFLGFAIFDVIVGDRAELLEHSTYVGVLLISFLAIAAEMFFNHLRRLTQEENVEA
ncbi:hypothetical protein [uncultured Roseibium sp.]|uniref:hypothetical protein n=1 Tax=uncultured Roseibium sp. TaxID=1936171 RepID=UPI002594E033|nr:hypothetical protein [uncultured Roseibium sp.]